MFQSEHTTPTVLRKLLHAKTIQSKDGWCCALSKEDDYLMEVKRRKSLICVCVCQVGVYYTGYCSFVSLHSFFAV